MSNLLRCFIAIELSTSVRQSLSKIQSQLKQTGADVKWVNPENIHLTLKFLGEIPPPKVDAVCQLLPSLLQDVSPFTIDLTHVGGFPDLKRPRIIWIGVTQNAQRVTELAQMIETGLCTLGITKEDRNFSAHITLGRVKSKKTLHPLCGLLTNYSLTEALEQNVGEIILFKSTLLSTGPVYEKLLTTKLT